MYGGTVTRPIGLFLQVLYSACRACFTAASNLTLGAGPNYKPEKHRRMPKQFGIVVAGAGHNSLIAAAYLAKAGYRCLVLEVRPIVGGGVMTEEVTLPGFK